MRMAAYAALDRASQRIAPLLATGGGMTRQQQHRRAWLRTHWCSATSPPWRNWYLDGGIHPIADYVDEGMRPLRKIWSTRRAN